MFKRLRNQFMLLLMTILTVVMASALVAAYLLVSANVQLENQRKLDAEIVLWYYSSAADKPLPVLVEYFNTGGSISYVEVFSDTEKGTALIENMLSIQELENMHSIQEPVPETVSVLKFYPSTSIKTKSGYIDDDGYIVQIEGALSSEVYSAGLEFAAAVGKSQGTFTYKSRNLMYKVVPPQEVAPSDWDTSTYTIPVDLSDRTADDRIALIDVTDSHAMLAQLRYLLLAFGVVMLGVLYLISRLVAKRAVQPVERSWERQQQFVSDASHELKTPLSIISANHEVLMAHREQTVASQQKWLAAIGTQTARMDTLVSDLLTLSKAAEEPVALISVEASVLVSELCADFEALAYEKDITLRAEIEPNVKATGETEGMRRAFDALLDNAVKYTPKGGEIGVSLSRTRNQVEFRVRNTGVSIPPGELSQLFDRFYRLDPSRSIQDTTDQGSDDAGGASDADVAGETAEAATADDASGDRTPSAPASAPASASSVAGYGLGLAIAKDTVTRFGGRIEAASDQDSVTLAIRLRASA